MRGIWFAAGNTYFAPAAVRHMCEIVARHLGWRRDVDLRNLSGSLIGISSAERIGAEVIGNIWRATGSSKQILLWTARLA